MKTDYFYKQLDRILNFTYGHRVNVQEKPLSRIMNNYLLFITLKGTYFARRPGTIRIYADRFRSIREMGYEPDQTKEKVHILAGRKRQTKTPGRNKKDRLERLLRLYCRRVRSVNDKKTDVFCPPLVKIQWCRHDGGDGFQHSSTGPDRTTILQSRAGEQDLENSADDGVKILGSSERKSRHGAQEHRSLQAQVEQPRSTEENSDSSRKSSQEERPDNTEKNQRKPQNMEEKTAQETRLSEVDFYEAQRRAAKQRKDFDRLVKQNLRQSRDRYTRRFPCRPKDIWQRLIQSNRSRSKNSEPVPRSRESEPNVRIPATGELRPKREDKTTRQDDGELDISGCKGGPRRGIKKTYFARRPFPSLAPIQNKHAPAGMPGQVGPYEENIVSLARDLNEREPK